MPRIENFLIKSEDNIRALFHSIPIPTHVFQKIGEELILIDYNAAAEKVSTKNIKNSLGFKASELFKEQHDHLKNLYQCYNEQINFQKDVKFFSKPTGAKKSFSINYSFIPPDIVIVSSEEFTERKKAEQQLKESEEKFRTFFEANPEITYITDSEGNFLEANQSFLDNIGYSLEDIKAKNLLDYFRGDNTEELLKGVAKLRAGEEIRGFEVKAVCADGTIRDYEINAIPIKKDGVVETFLSVARDMTEHREFNEALQVSEEKFRELFNYMSSGVAIYKAIDDGRDFIFSDFNLAGEKIESIKKEDLLYKSVLEVFPGVKEFGLFDAFQRVWKTGKPERHPISLYKDERITGWRDNYIYKLSTGEIVAVYDDLTDQKQAEQEIKRSHETMKKILKLLPVGILSLGYDKKVRSANKAALEMLGYDTKEDIVGKSCYETFCPANKGACPIIDQGQQIDKSERFFISREGIEIPILKSVIPITLSGENVLLEAFIDITRIKEAQRKLEKSEEKYRKAYEQANFYKDLFAHDINNVLNNIKSSVQLYSLYQEEPDKTKEMSEMIDIIREQVIKGTNLISNVRKLSQFEDGVEIDTEEIVIHEKLEDAIKFTQDSFLDRTIKIDIKHVNKDLKVQANELLFDVFQNILNNAVRYNDNPLPVIFIKISKERQENKNYVKIEFIDNGIGVSDDLKKIIFKKGHEQEKGTKGMGFGLSLVKKVIKSYNGQIWVEDKVKGDHTKGSNFMILIPEIERKSG